VGNNSPENADQHVGHGRMYSRTLDARAGADAFTRIITWVRVRGSARHHPRTIVRMNPRSGATAGCRRPIGERHAVETSAVGRNSPSDVEPFLAAKWKADRDRLPRLSEGFSSRRRARTLAANTYFAAFKQSLLGPPTVFQPDSVALMAVL